MCIRDRVFNTAAIAGVRFLWRLVLTMRNAKANKPEDNTPLLIVGAGNAGAWAVNLCKTKNQSFGNPVCIVDDDLTKKGLRVQGVPVRGTISDIPELVRKYHILEIVIAITTVKGDRCLLYTSDAADDPLCGDFGGHRIIKNKKRS